MPNLALLGSRIRITIFSPNIVGKVLTRKSITRSGPIFSFILPSCGTRFSEMSSLEITLMRAASFSLIATGGEAISRSSPSTRKRTRYVCSNGSKCKSEARMLKASNSIFCKNFTTGASSTSDAAASLMSEAASVVNSSNSKSSPMMCSIASAALVVDASTILDSLSYSAITQSTPIWVENLIFSATSWSDGSAVATIKRLLRLLNTIIR